MMGTVFKWKLGTENGRVFCCGGAAFPFPKTGWNVQAASVTRPRPRAAGCGKMGPRGRGDSCHWARAGAAGRAAGAPRPAWEAAAAPPRPVPRGPSVRRRRVRGQVRGRPGAARASGAGSPGSCALTRRLPGPCLFRLHVSAQLLKCKFIDNIVVSREHIFKTCS